jgi:O-antigen ligase
LEGPGFGLLIGLIKYHKQVIKDQERFVVSHLLSWVAVLTTLAMAPGVSFDPINVPKQVMLAIGGFSAAAFLISKVKLFTEPNLRLPIFSGLIFILDLILVLVFAGNNFNQEFFGTDGRSTGFVAYFSLATLFIAAVMISTNKVIVRFSRGLLFAGLISIVYGFVQSLGLDPVGWTNSYSPVIGFLGNPDFQSSFVAISAVFVSSLCLGKDVKAKLRGAGFLYLGAAAYVIKETGAQQGFVVLAVGSFLALIVKVYTLRRKFLTGALMLLGILIMFAAALGSLNKGPLSALLHKDSVIYRGDYWRAGWKMSLEHPLFGIGLDSYGDWYRRTRTLAATIRRGPEIVSNASHNVLIDFSSNGGFPLLIIYLILMGLVVRASWKLIKREDNFDPILTGLIVVWIAYQAQSIISLNQLGLAVWGWIISGLIIGYEINTRSHFTQENSRSRLTKVGPSFIIVLLVGFLTGLMAGLPPFLASAKFRNSIQTGDARIIQAAAYIYPLDFVRMAQIAGTLRDNNLDTEALLVISDAVQKFPDSFDSWRVFSTLKSATPAQVAIAKAQMKRLDPLNPDLK